MIGPSIRPEANELLQQIGDSMNVDSPKTSPEIPTLDSCIPVLVGRQAIFNRRLQVHAYELLHRTGIEGEANFEDGDQATATVISNAFIELGLDTVTGGKPAFINLTHHLITTELARLFPPERIVVEILEDVEATDEIVERVRALKDAGYCIALDDFVYFEHLRPLVELADIIKIDVFELGLEKVALELEKLAEFDLELLAEKVETHEEFEACKDMGFHYFQGYFLCRPQIIQGSKPKDDGLGIIKLLACLNDPKATRQELEQVITNDAKLCYRLMSYINSAAFSLTGVVDSIHHAMTLLGERVVRNWANMVVLSGKKGKSNEILTTALMRAYMCKSLAEKLKLKDPEEYFTVGMFSVLDALLGMNMSDIVEQLPLSTEITNGLLFHDGMHGQILELSIAYERNPQTVIKSDLVDSICLRQAYLEALEWVSRINANSGDDNADH